MKRLRLLTPLWFDNHRDAETHAAQRRSQLCRAVLATLWFTAFARLICALLET